MEKRTILQPFSKGFLSQFVVAPQTLPFSDEEIMERDRELAEYEQVFLNPDIERNLISKNELLASFAISKAEDSQLTLSEAKEVYHLLLAEPEYDFIGNKLKTQAKLTKRDHDRLEFFNVVKTFRQFNQRIISIAELTPHMIRGIHSELAKGLDIFQQHLPQFTVYRAGAWRDNDAIRVGEYVPASYLEVPDGIVELIAWLKDHQTPTGIGIFHTALYALHPFNNGNKRVCRVLEHALLRGIGLNAKNLYSTSYYYHKQKSRYYKRLLQSLERKNLNHFTAFVQESLLFSIFDVVATSLEVKRNAFLDRRNLDGPLRVVLKSFVKRSELQFKAIARITRTKMARQTLVTSLQEAVAQDILKKREEGRATYYRLHFDAPERETLEKWLALAEERLAFIPNDIKNF